MYARTTLLIAVCSTLLLCCTTAHDVANADAAAYEPEDPGGQAGAAARPLEADMQPHALCERLARLQCEAEQRCCEAPGRDLETCQTIYRDECEQSVHLDQVAANSRSGFDKSAAEETFARLERELEACSPDIARWSASRLGLRSIFKGTAAEGESCKPEQFLSLDRALQAAALVSCRDPETTACLPISLLGEWTCVPKSAVSANCLTDDNCEEDAFCSNPQQDPLGRCELRAPEGSVCADAAQCATLFCRSGECVRPSVQEAYCPSPS